MFVFFFQYAFDSYMDHYIGQHSFDSGSTSIGEINGEDILRDVFGIQKSIKWINLLIIALISLIVRVAHFRLFRMEVMSRSTMNNSLKS